MEELVDETDRFVARLLERPRRNPGIPRLVQVPEYASR
jgi:hypothetical protein